MKALIVDLFAGGGGAGLGIERALGRSPDIAINHSPLAIACHVHNHPKTTHLNANVWEFDPLNATDGKAVEVLWASPACRNFSRAKDSEPLSNRVRLPAWVVTPWAKATRPQIITLENVAEFQTWGPLGTYDRSIKNRAGETFRRRVGQIAPTRLRRSIWRILNAADVAKAPLLGRPKRRQADPMARADARNQSAAEYIDWSDIGSSTFGRKNYSAPVNASKE